MEEDVLSPIDLRDPATAQQWAEEADRKRPWRTQIRETFAGILRELGARRVLELGAGPGQLAACILDHTSVEDYVLLDFSPPMHALARARLAHHGDRARHVLDDFKAPGWSQRLGETGFDAIVAMQAVHELRHKRHALGLYREARSLAPVLVVCDHEPAVLPGSRFTEDQIRALSSTALEQHAAFRAAGFEPRTALEIEGMYVVAGVAPVPDA
jgi:SAM-dependent methyltransferase